MNEAWRRRMWTSKCIEFNMLQLLIPHTQLIFSCTLLLSLPIAIARSQGFPCMLRHFFKRNNELNHGSSYNFRHCTQILSSRFILHSIQILKLSKVRQYKTSWGKKKSYLTII